MCFFFFFVGEKALGEHPDVCREGRGALRRPQQLEFREYHLFWSRHTFELFNKAVEKSHICVLLHPLKLYFLLYFLNLNINRNPNSHPKE